MIFDIFYDNFTVFEITALALGDTSVKIKDVTPQVFPSGPLFASEVYFS